MKAQPLLPAALKRRRGPRVAVLALVLCSLLVPLAFLFDRAPSGTYRTLPRSLPPNARARITARSPPVDLGLQPPAPCSGCSAVRLLRGRVGYFRDWLRLAYFPIGACACACARDAGYVTTEERHRQVPRCFQPSLLPAAVLDGD
jgi:hypothetical protein